MEEVEFVSQISEIEVDPERMIADYEVCKTLSGWSENEPYRQIGLRHRPTTEDNKWWESEGSLFSRGISEVDFSVWNEQTPSYTRYKVEEICDHLNFEIGRVRYMNTPPQFGLKVHFDTAKRLHFVIKTNPDAHLFHKIPNTETLKHYHLKVSQNFYLIDTTQWHFVYNSGYQDRIHLVIS